MNDDEELQQILIEAARAMQPENLANMRILKTPNSSTVPRKIKASDLRPDLQLDEDLQIGLNLFLYHWQGQVRYECLVQIQSGHKYGGVLCWHLDAKCTRITRIMGGPPRLSNRVVTPDVPSDLTIEYTKALLPILTERLNSGAIPVTI